MWAPGDINGDGIEDIGINVRDADNFIVSGGQSLPEFITASTPATLNVLVQHPAESYRNARGLGDINGDQIDDIGYGRGSVDNRELLLGRPILSPEVDQPEPWPALTDICTQSTYSCDVSPIGDFDNDGFDDVVVDRGTVLPNSDPRYAENLIFYGGPDGVITTTPEVAAEEGRLTRVVLRSRYGTTFSRAGDINGDGAMDIRTGGSAVIYGTPGKRPHYILLSSIDGSNGFYQSGGVYGRVGTTIDFNGDRIDDMQGSGNRYIPGVASFRRAADPQSLFLWQGNDSLDLHWTLPENNSAITNIRIIWNDDTMATLEPATTKFQLAIPEDLQSGLAKVQSLDTGGNVIGEATKFVGSLGPQYTELEATYGDEELPADGRWIPAIDYTLSATVYDASLAELFWNQTERFVLIWRGDEIIARTEGNSFLITSAEHGSGEYFLSIDYFGAIPQPAAALRGTSGTLQRSNRVRIDF